MKKKNLLVLAALMSFPLVVKADLSLPESSGYTAEMLQDFKCEDGGGTLKKGAKVNVVYELDGKVYVLSNDTYCEMDSKYVKAVGEYNLKDAKKVSINYYTLKDETMYKGPGFGYEKEGYTIKKGTKVTATYTSGDYSFWSYVEINGHKGWIYTLRQDISAEEESDQKTVPAVIPSNKYQIVVYGNGYLYKDSSMKSKISGVSIKSGTTLDVKYYIEYLFGGLYYVEYNGTKGWYYGENDGSYLMKNESKILITKDGTLKVFTKINDEKTITKINVKEGQVINATENDENIRHYETWYKISLDGKDYFFASDYVIGGSDNEEAYDMNEDMYTTYTSKIKYKSNKQLLVYSTAFSDDGKEATFDTFVSEYYSVNSRYYVENVGWVTTENEGEGIEEVGAVEDQSKEDDNQSTQEEKKEEKTASGKKYDIKQIALICGVEAIIVSLVAFVSVILVNKNKKSKNESK